LVVVWIAHGYFTELFRERLGIPPGFYHYGSVNMYEYSEELKKWNLKEIDAKYY